MKVFFYIFFGGTPVKWNETGGENQPGDMQSERCGWLCDISLFKAVWGEEGYRRSITERQQVLEEKTRETQ